MHVQVLLVAECTAMFGTLTPVVRAVLYANVIVFGLQWLTGPSLLPALFALWPFNSARLTGVPFEPWQLVTYAFLHEGFWHIAGNMFALYVFGPDVELLLGAKRFTLYYFVCVIGAALTQLWVVQYLYPTPYPTVGASGGIFGLLLFYGMAFPHRRMLLLIPPIPMPAWLLVTLYGALELVLGVFGTSQGIAHFAHLGGMATGFLMILYWRWQQRRRSHAWRG
jgi:membrane associated rhomboid family serine protease